MNLIKPTSPCLFPFRLDTNLFFEARQIRKSVGGFFLSMFQTENDVWKTIAWLNQIPPFCPRRTMNVHNWCVLCQHGVIVITEKKNVHNLPDCVFFHMFFQLFSFTKNALSERWNRSVTFCYVKSSDCNFVTFKFYTFFVEILTI